MDRINRMQEGRREIASCLAMTGGCLEIPEYQFRDVTKMVIRDATIFSF